MYCDIYNFLKHFSAHWNASIPWQFQQANIIIFCVLPQNGFFYIDQNHAENFGMCMSSKGLQMF